MNPIRRDEFLRNHVLSAHSAVENGEPMVPKNAPASPDSTTSPNSFAEFSRIRIVLSAPRHPGNIGAAARAMKTMGLSHLTLVAPERFPHPEASARAAGAEDILDSAEIHTTLSEALEDAVFALAVSARARRLGPEPVSPRVASLEALSFAASGNVAFVFGNESSGLSNDEIMRCQRVVRIPANPEYSSLNLGAAVQVLCYALRCTALDVSKDAARDASRGTVGTPSSDAVPAFASPSASIAELERFYAHLESVMIATDFLDPTRPRRLLPKLRRLFGRARPESEEINILRGILDAVEKKMRRETPPNR
jgi:tRNA/rRNA methyltransferase